MPQFVNQTPPISWTNQNQGTTGTLSPDVEQGPGASPYLFGGAAFAPGQNGYLAWSMSPEDAINAVTAWPTTNTNLLTRVFVPISGFTTKCDFFPITIAATTTSILVGLYSSTGAQLSVSPAITTGFGAMNGTTQTVTWTTPTYLSAGSFYYVAMIVAWATTSPIFAATLNASAPALNAGLTTATAESQTNGTSATLPASYTMSAGTTLGYEFFVGLR
jgi:hypothetical protein